MNVDVKSLTDKQRELAETNHSLIYKYAFENGVSLDEFYGALAVGLCKAAQAYDETRGKFSTFAYRCMENEFLRQWNRQHRKSDIPDNMMFSYDELYESMGYNLEACISEEFLDYRCYDDIICGMMLDVLMDGLTEREKKIVSLAMAGLKCSEIAGKIGCSQQNVSYYMKRIKDKAKPLFEQ